MSQNPPLTPAQALDEQLWQVYAPGVPANATQRAQALGGTELKMLAKLFTSGLFGPAIQAAAAGQTAGKPRVALAWVDKRPVAAVAGQRRTEYGDMAVFRIHGYKTGAGSQHFNARCLLLQAKVATEAAQWLAPSVPVNPGQPRPGSSTKRELALMRRGPLHDLYEYGASKDPLAQGLKPGRAEAWYMATPRRPLPILWAPWRSPWMCGPALNGAACDVSLGELLTSFLAGEKVRRPQDGGGPPQALAGRAFGLNLADLRADAGRNGRAAVQAQHWDRVCVEILRGMRGFDLPTYLTGGQPTGGLRTIHLYANPIEPVCEALLRGVAHLRRALGRSKMLVVVVASDGSD